MHAAAIRRALCGLLLLWPIQSLADSPEWELGRGIFQSGMGRDGRAISGQIHGNLLLRGPAVACASCHGVDARGGGEAFVRAPDIRWYTLSKPFAPRRAGQARPAYTREAFRRALHQGVASDRRRLDPAMPQFDLSEDEMEALIQYLSRPGGQMGEDGAPSKRVLALLPSAGKTRLTEELRERLRSCPTAGAGARFPPLEIVTYTTAADAVSQVDAKLEAGRVSHILAPYIAGWETQYLDAARRWSVVSYFPVTPLDLPAHPMVAFSLPGLTSQIAALLERGLPPQAEALTVVTLTGVTPAEELLHFLRAALDRRHLRLQVVQLDRGEPLPSASPWLLLAPLNQVAKHWSVASSEAGGTVLVPAMFFDEVTAERIERDVHLRWNIAYPYPPLDKQTGHWLSPADIWSEAACTVMALVGAEAGQRTGQKTGREADQESGQTGLAERAFLTLSTGTKLTNAQTIDERQRQVTVGRWEKGTYAFDLAGPPATNR